MAFTLTQRAEIRYYTGWSGRWHQVDSELERALSAIDGVAEIEALVLADLASCKDVDAKLLDADKRLKALKVGSIVLPAKNEIDELEKKGRKFAKRLASQLGVEVRNDMFDSSKPVGRQTYGGISGGGNYALHG